MNTNVLKNVLALVCIGILLNAALAQQAPASLQESRHDRIELHQALLDLTNPWTVMCIAAHPDDEDGTSLIVMRRKYGAHTVSLFTTFGEGGQNAIGPELYEELGAIRVKETEAAADIQGSEPHFLGLKDFGYSKSADEAFRVWGHQEALRRMVLQIRTLRPDVIITNHSATNNDHGHHQATARLELEAFEAAADPKRFPEQLKDDVTVWQVQRLFVRAGRSNQADAGPSGVVSIDPNERDPIRGTTYAEQALQALQQHATQGPWPKTVADMARFRNSPDGRLPAIRYVLMREAKGTPALVNGSNNFVDGLRLGEDVARFLQPTTIEGRPLTDFIHQRAKLIHALAVEKDKMAAPLTTDAINSEARYRLSYRVGRMNSALLSAAGVAARLSTNNPLIPGATTSFTFTISNHGSQPLKLETLSPPSQLVPPRVVVLKCCPSGFSDRVIRPGESLNVPLSFSTPVSTSPTVPHATHLYDEKMLGLAAVTYAFARIDVTEVTVPAFKIVDVAPAVAITAITPEVAIVSSQNQRAYFTLRVTNHQNKEFRGRITPRVVPACESIACKEAAFALSSSVWRDRGARKILRLGPTETAEVKFEMSSGLLTKTRPDAGGRGTSAYKLVFRTEQQSSKGAWEIIGESTPVVVSYADVSLRPDIRVGYVRGFDYSLPHALAALGVDSKELSVNEIKTSDLQKYSTVVVDNRVYESQPELIAANQKLLNYVNEGGTLIVFYHKSNEWNPNPRVNRPQLAPYPIVLGDERVTDENAAVTFSEPGHPLLNSPNKMGQEDFAGWIQERGLYYPKEWDTHYQALLAMSDPGEAPLKGGLLVANYGRGHYIYTSMVWYRQLRAGVPGAYRMLANMISYRK